MKNAWNCAGQTAFSAVLLGCGRSAARTNFPPGWSCPPPALLFAPFPAFTPDQYSFSCGYTRAAAPSTKKCFFCVALEAEKPL